MISTVKVIFCDNEHGTGDMMFPDPDDLLEHLRDGVYAPQTAAQLRKSAKKAGWSRHAGADYCPGCTEGGI